MEVYNTSDKQSKPSIVMLLYGQGGVGKTTFASTAPKPILADCEGGAKYFGLRGISMDVAKMEGWETIREFYTYVKDSGDKYETIIVDPIGEAMEKLMRYQVAMGDKKLIQSDGSPTMAGWGWLKKTMRAFLKSLRDTDKHVILVAHVDEKDDDGRMVKRPMIVTKLSQEIVNMVDVVGYMVIAGTGEEAKRAILVDPESDKYIAKDRTGQLGKVIEPDFAKIIKACQGTKKYKWSKTPEFLDPSEDNADGEPTEPTKKEKEDIAEVEAMGSPVKPSKKNLAKSAKDKLAKLRK